ncbi:MAG TPA: efflux RND transporter periplasmic adaptor subunit [Nitrospiria bacterium]|nr:efflux RND transporter periplasmic adaptor subunit [Nitrospiria bacterium]
MTKRMVIMLLIVGLLFGAIFGFQAFKAKMIKQFMASMKMPPATVTAMKAELRPWQPQLNAVGSLRAVHGVDVTSEIGGLVREVRFASGDEAKAGQVLVQLNADADVGLLRSLEAAAELARTTYERDKAQFAIQAVSQAALDADAADLKSKEAQVAQQAAVVDKKTIRALFDGRLGINAVNLGQYVNPGDKIVTLQSLDPIYVDFSLPQQQLSRVKLGQTVTATTDAYPGRAFEGKITAVNPKVDPDTRNVQIEATVANPKHDLLPGMYASVTVESGAVQSYLTLPQTAVTFNPYGESVYVIEEGAKGADGKPVLTAKQTFVTVGETRGDQVAIVKGIKPGDLVATSGQLKLKNGSAVVVNNTVQPSNDVSPAPTDQ